MWTILRSADLRPVPWRNGQGVTWDIVTRLGPDGNLAWQASIADLDHAADFSDFTHFDRIFTPISGGLVELSFDDGPFAPCPILVPVPFAGERRTRCRITGGPGRAFNAIADRRVKLVAVNVLNVPAGGRVETGSAAECVLYCWDGVIEAQDERLLPGDSTFGPYGPAWTAVGPSVVLRVLVS